MCSSSPAPRRPLQTLAFAIALGLLAASPAKAEVPDRGAELHGVALDDLAGALTARLDAWLRANPPGELRHIHRVVIGPPADPTAPLSELGTCAPRELLLDILGNTHKPGPASASGGHHGTRQRDDRGRRTHVPVTDIVRVRMALPSDLESCDWPASFEPEFVDAWPLKELTPSIRVSIHDRAALIEDRARAFRRLLPAGVGAIDTVRRPGATTSLTPASEHARISPESSHRTYGTPRVFHGEPFLALEAPTARRNGIGHYPTRVGFHVYQSWRFFRGYVSRGCVTLRTGDIRELRDLLFAVDRAIPVRIDVAPLPGARHPYPLADDFHFALKAFGPKDAPTFRVSGGLYVTEKVLAAPPRELVGVHFDSEAELLKRREVAAGARGTEPRRL